MKSFARGLSFLAGRQRLLLTDPAAVPPRPTKDVDLIIEVASRGAYALLQLRLRELGFKEDASPYTPLCRWLIEGIKVDVMPTEESVLGFSNRWFPETIASAGQYALPNGLVIRLVAAPQFIATKLEAFKGRGRGIMQ